MKTDWSMYQITYDGITYGLHYRNAVDLIACEGYVPNSPSPTYPSPILSAGGNLVCGASSVTMPTLRSLSDGTKDTLEYLGAGVWRHTQNIGHKVFNGTESVQLLRADATKVCLYYKIGANSNTFDDNTRPGSSTHWGVYSYDIAVLLTEAGAGEAFGIASTTSNAYFSILASRLQSPDAAGFKAWLSAQYAAGTPVIVDYQLATPIVTDLTLGELKTYPRQTTITQDGATKGMVTAGALIIDKGVI